MIGVVKLAAQKMHLALYFCPLVLGHPVIKMLLITNPILCSSSRIKNSGNQCVNFPSWKVFSLISSWYNSLRSLLLKTFSKKTFSITHQRTNHLRIKQFCEQGDFIVQMRWVKEAKVGDFGLRLKLFRVRLGHHVIK